MRARFEAEGKEWDDEAAATARTVGLSAVKYADLSMNRESNYRFSYKKMLALTGNTAPYMLYAVARINGIRRKIGNDASATGALTLSHPAELLLARHLLVLPELLHEVERTLYPHRLCDYIFELSQRFNQFYENCPVANAPSPEEKASRAALCDATASTLEAYPSRSSPRSACSCRIAASPTSPGFPALANWHLSLWNHLTPATMCRSWSWGSLASRRSSASKSICLTARQLAPRVSVKPNELFRPSYTLGRGTPRKSRREIVTAAKHSHSEAPRQSNACLP
jgi:hypothetical protein